MDKTAQWNAQDVTYEECCDICRELVIEIDNKRWIVGDYALHIETHYGDKTMESFARDIGMNKSTLAGWKRVAEFYPNIIRRNLLDTFPNLTYSYFKDALRCGDVDQATAWLELCSSEGWSADQAAHELTKRLGHETRESAEGEIHGYGDFDTYHTITFKVSSDDLAWLLHVKKVVIRAK